MSFADTLKDKLPVLLLNLTCALLLSLYLLGLGIGKSELALILLLWALVLCGWLAAAFFTVRARLRALENTMASLDQKYLFAEVAALGGSAEQRAYHGLLRQALRAMTEQVAASRREKNEYREFIEQWAHELKAPITSITLLCENHLDDVTRKILLQNKEIGDDLEKVLYYARLDNVEKDYLIKESSLEEIVNDALLRSKQLLIQNRFSVNAHDLAFTVGTDAKWLGFILNQLISNSVRYKREPAALEISAADLPDAVRLDVWDNGIGIKESELGRVFQKGFTGSNGRLRKNSTGIGLYLCKGLCDALGLALSIRSAPGRYTCVSILFPHVPPLDKR